MQKIDRGTNTKLMYMAPMGSSCIAISTIEELADHTKKYGKLALG
jgi:hypothetical protein